MLQQRIDEAMQLIRTTDNLEEALNERHMIFRLIHSVTGSECAILAGEFDKQVTKLLLESDKTYTVYKVIKDNGQSACVRGAHAAIQYLDPDRKPLQNVTAPKWLAKHGYHIAAFTNQDRAYSFLCGNLYQDIGRVELRLWRAEGKHIITNLPGFIPPAWMEQWYEGKIEQDVLDRLEYDYHWPSNTIMCKSITLVEEVTV